MYAIDFFCGAGGLSKGLALSGIDVLAGLDNNIRCQQTYNTNNAPARFILADLTKYSPKDLLDELPQLNAIPQNELLLAGCAPCQPFSQANKSGEWSSDATLLSRFGRFIDYFLPGQVMIENVPGIARVKGNSTFRRFLSLLEGRGYNVVYQSINAKGFGVPQNRVRMLGIALRNAEASFPAPTHSDNPNPQQMPLVTVRDAIAHYPLLAAGETHAHVENHVAARLSEHNLERLRHTPPNGGGRNDWPENLRLECHMKANAGHSDVYGRMYWDRPSPTLTCKCYSISNGRYAHPEQDRGISLREAASIQTFPEDYVFYGTNTSIAAQIGNAVPVLLGQAMGTHIQHLRREAERNQRRV